MRYHIEFTETAKEHIRKINKEMPSLRPKIEQLIRELTEHPLTGTGKPEKLRFKLSGHMSRRINVEHRLVYQIDEENQCVLIEALLGHY